MNNERKAEVSTGGKNHFKAVQRRETMLPPLDIIISICLLALTLCLLRSHSVSGQCPADTNDSGSSGERANTWWMLYAGRCYKYFNDTKPWFPAEVACRAYGGHLVTIPSEQVNRLVGRLSDCRDTWIGRFSTNYHRPTDPDAYEWTEEHGPTADLGATHQMYNRHNFSTMTDHHMGAVRASQLSWHNGHYHEELPYICEVPSQAPNMDEYKCPSSFTAFRNNCYWLSDFPANFVEANLHCEREFSSQMASVHNREELMFVGSLELDSDACTHDTLWLGLIKQNPCRPAKDVSGSAVCFQWTDFSGEHTGYPDWIHGHPIRDDWTINCVSLTAEGLQSEKCYTRHKFVCKRAASPAHMPAGAEPVK